MQTRKTSITYQVRQLNELVQRSRDLLPETFRETFQSRLKRLSDETEKLKEPVLNVGLLGGTGVGKSTIINALAGAEISSVSDRRPHTDLIVVYRHKKVEVPSDIPDGYLKKPHKVHENDSIRNLIIYDFPDFDSILTEHAQRVLNVLQFLDVSVWVVSPEKYADLEFYSFLKKTSIHQDNFIFVMNKVDTIKAEGASAEDKLKTLLGDFALKLKKTGILAPRIYGFAAKAINSEEAPAWWKTDFYNFRNYLFRKRDAREIQAIKEANIEVEIRELIDDLKVLYEKYRHLPVELDGILLEFQKDFYELTEKIPAITKPFITAGMIAELKEHILDNRCNLAPVRFFKSILETGTGWRKARGAILSDDSRISPNDERFDPVRNRFKSVFLKISTVLQRYGIDSPQKDIAMLEKLLDNELREFVSESKESLLEFFESAPRRRNRLRKWLHRVKQWFYLSVPGIFLVISLAGVNSLKRFVAHPAFDRGMEMIFNVILSLYTSSGLISLLSFLVIEIIILFFLASASLREDEREVAKEVENFNNYLASRLSKRLEYFKGQIDKTVEKIARESRIAENLLDELASMVK